MTKGESILIEQVVNGFIVNPKEVSSLTENKRDLHVFETVERLKVFLDEHFGGEKKKEEEEE